MKIAEIEAQELQDITAKLHTGETIKIKVAGAFFTPGPGSDMHYTLAFTGKRIILKSFLQKWIQPIALSQVKSISLHKGLMSSTVTLVYHSPGISEQRSQFIFGKNDANVVAFVEAIQQHIDQRHPAEAARAKVAADEQAKRPKLLRFLDRVGMVEIIIFAITICISVWSWLAYVVHTPQDIYMFGYVFLGANLLGAAAQTIYAIFIRPAGSFRQRTTLKSWDEARQGSSVVYWAPALIYAVVFLLITPPGTSAAAVEYGWNIYQAIGLFAMLSFLAAAFGSLLLTALIILPLSFIIMGVLPEEKKPDGRPVEPISRTEYLCTGLIVIMAIVFAVGMQFIAPERIATNSSRARMFEQFIYFITLHGALIPTIIGFFCIILIVVLGIISNRAAKRRVQSYAHPVPTKKK